MSQSGQESNDQGRARKPPRTGWVARLSIVVAAVLALAGFRSHASTVAQTETSFESDQFGYLLEWDETWQLGQPLVNEGFEAVVLSDDDKLVSFIALSEESGELTFASAEEVLTFVVDGLVDQVEDAEVVDDDPDADVPYAELTYSGSAGPAGSFVEVFALEDAEAFLYSIVEAPEEEFEDALAQAAEGITLDGDPFLAQDRAGQEGDEDEGDEGDDDPTGRDDEEDDTDENGGTDDDGGADTDEDETGDTEVYESPTYGFALEFDPEVWEVTGETSEGGVDTVSFFNGPSFVTLSAADVYAGDPEDCFDDWAGFLGDNEEIEDFAPLEDEDGEPIADEGDDFVSGAFSFTSEDGEEVFDLECRVLIEDEATLVILLETFEEEYEDQVEAKDELLEGLDLSGLESAEDGGAEDEDENGTDDETDEGEGQDDADPDEGTGDEEDEDEAGTALVVPYLISQA